MSHHNIKGFDVTEPGEIERLREINRQCSELFDAMGRAALRIRENPEQATAEFISLRDQFREIAGRKGQ